MPLIIILYYSIRPEQNIFVCVVLYENMKGDIIIIIYVW